MYVDPPWSYRDKCVSGNRGAAFKYDCLSFDELSAMQVWNLASKDSLLYLWSTAPMVPEALRLMEAWDFTFKTFAFVWVKVAKDQGNIYDIIERVENEERLEDMLKIMLGGGSYTRANAEFVLLGKRGKGVPVVNHGVSQVVVQPRERHSKKPDSVRERISSLHDPRVRKIELFARPEGHESEDGWVQWGNDEMIDQNTFDLVSIKLFGRCE